MRIGLHHYGIYCRDIEESIAFYVDVLGFKHLFSTMAMEGDKPLKMAWVKSADGVIAELLEQEDKSTIDAAGACLNHVAVRVASMDDIVARLEERGVAIEAGPFDALCEFDRPLEDADGDGKPVRRDARSHDPNVKQRGRHLVRPHRRKETCHVLQTAERRSGKEMPEMRREQPRPR